MKNVSTKQLKRPKRNEPSYVSFRPLRVTIAKKGLKMTHLADKGLFSRSTMVVMNRDDYVSMEVVARICRYLDVPIEEVVEVVRGNSPE